MTHTHARLNELVRRARQGDLAGVRRSWPEHADDGVRRRARRAARRATGRGRGAGGVPAGVPAARRSGGSGGVRRLAPPHRHHRRAEHAAGAAARRCSALDDVPDVPVLDEAETRWSELQRQRLAGALLTLTQRGAPAVRPPVSRRLEHGRLAARRRRRRERRCGSACSAFATSCARRWKWQNNVTFARRDPARLPGQGRRAAGAAAADRPAGEPGRADVLDLLRGVFPTSPTSSCRRSSTSPRRARRSATTRSTSIRSSSIGSTTAASCATT